MTCDRARRAASVDRSRAGFTLLEVLIALAISGLCLMMLSGVVGRMAKTQRVMSDHAAVLDQGEAIVRLLRDLLRSVDVEMRDARVPNLTGHERELTIRTQGPAVLNLDDETMFRLHFVAPRAPGEAGTLALAWTNPTTGVAFDETVATGVTTLQVAYRARKDGDGWQGSWVRPVVDLVLVRIEITFAAGQRATPVSAILAVGTRLPQACVVDPLLDRCPQW